MPADFEIRLAPGAEELGLANMLRDLLTQNLDQHPRKISDFKKLKIGIGLVITDAEIAMTLGFAGGLLTIYPGLRNRPGLVIFAESNQVMALSNQRIKWGLPYYFDDTGREILSAMKSGRLKVKGLLSHFPSLIRLSRVMSVH
ncbi:MAG: hypothetical protein AB1641_15910 [Thermodesulfobacteriota bacterium]